MLTSAQIMIISMQTITTATTPGHRPQQLVLELGGENKPVCWLRDISTLIVLIGSKLKYASMHSWQRCPGQPDGDIRPEAILSTSFGSSRTATHRQVTCTCQIWISCWILPHFDVRTISVASKLKELQIFLYY